jgi:DAK2 domain fusion protein YloV
MMRVIDTCSGQELAEMFGSATLWLEKNADQINSLNVFPVPDGDTGINMLLTMRSAVEEASRSVDRSASAIVRAIAHGALMGARGNSGVILSQILRGLATTLDEKDRLEGSDLIAGLVAGSSLAYKAVSRPVEGTILTVVREASVAAQGVSTTNDLSAIMEATASAARDTVARTPTLLDVLREAGVVDAGGLGLYVIFEGFLRYLRGETDGFEIPAPISDAHIGAGISAAEQTFGYCTEFIIEGRNLNPNQVRERLESMGQSVLVVEDENLVRVHVHTLDPGVALSYATSLGTLRQVKVQNMDEQHEEFVAHKKPPQIGIATVAVVSGEGMEDVFRSLGVTAVVAGGQTMNPSTQELLKAVESVPSDKVILLPNNPNIVLSAEQARALSTKSMAIVPAETIPQGVSALLAFNNEADLEANVVAMKEAMSAVRTVEVTRAVRSAKFGDHVMKNGDAIAFLDGELAGVGGHIPRLVNEVLSQIELSRCEVVTVYYGADTGDAEAEAIAEALRREHPHLNVEAIHSGQPHYNYIISVE